MTKLSRNLLKSYVKEDVLREFWYTLDDLKGRNLFIFLQDIFTPTEIMMVAKRLAIIRALRQKISYPTIREEYKVTDTTIAKMNNILARASDDFLKVLDRLIRAEELHWEEFKETRKQASGIRGGKLVFARRI